jgi:tetratricopeptide (TPR) repeat protein
MTRVLAAFACVVLWLPALYAANEADLLRGLDTDDKVALDRAIAAIERASTTPELADVLFAAGRACEDRLHDPARALAIYDRIVRDLPDAGIAIAASRRIEQLRGVREHAKEAAELAHLIANADALPRADIVRRAEALIATPWPGAPGAALWLADWLCRTRQFADAQTRYGQVLGRWPASDESRLALRNATECAIAAGEWSLADQLARRLPEIDDVDRAVREDLLEEAARGRLRELLYKLSWLGLVVAVAGLLGSLAEAILRGGRRFPPLRPPIEVLFLAPIAAVIVFASFTAHTAIAPAVLRISLVGLALAWLSGASLDLLRARGRAVRLRAVVHVLACAVGVIAMGYIAMTREGLLDTLAETVRFGPGA